MIPVDRNDRKWNQLYFSNSVLSFRGTYITLYIGSNIFQWSVTHDFSRTKIKEILSSEPYTFSYHRWQNVINQLKILIWCRSTCTKTGHLGVRQVWCLVVTRKTWLRRQTMCQSTGGQHVFHLIYLFGGLSPTRLAHHPAGTSIQSWLPVKNINFIQHIEDQSILSIII